LLLVVITEIVAQLLAAAPVVVHLSNEVSTWEKVAAIFTAVGGIGAMVGAIFAWLAARRSGQTARDARDALAASLKPQVHLVISSYLGSIEVRAAVVGPLSPTGVAGVLPAADVRLQVNLSSGKQDCASIPRLEPSQSGSWVQHSPYLNVVIGEMTDDWPPEEGEHVTATVTFSDVRGVATYQKTTSVDLVRSEQPGGEWAVSFQNPTEPIETRISP
jgi:hypothetical protein